MEACDASSAYSAEEMIRSLVSDIWIASVSILILGLMIICHGMIKFNLNFFRSGLTLSMSCSIIASALSIALGFVARAVMTSSIVDCLSNNVTKWQFDKTVESVIGYQEILFAIALIAFLIAFAFYSVKIAHIIVGMGE